MVARLAGNWEWDVFRFPLIGMSRASAAADLHPILCSLPIWQRRSSRRGGLRRGNARCPDSRLKRDSESFPNRHKRFDKSGKFFGIIVASVRSAENQAKMILVFIVDGLAFKPILLKGGSCDAEGSVICATGRAEDHDGTSASRRTRLYCKLTLDRQIPADHLLRSSAGCRPPRDQADLAPFYSCVARPSIDP